MSKREGGINKPRSSWGKTLLGFTAENSHSRAGLPIPAAAGPGHPGDRGTIQGQRDTQETGGQHPSCCCPRVPSMQEQPRHRCKTRVIQKLLFCFLNWLSSKSFWGTSFLFLNETFSKYFWKFMTGGLSSVCNIFSVVFPPGEELKGLGALWHWGGWPGGQQGTVRQGSQTHQGTNQMSLNQARFSVHHLRAGICAPRARPG